MKKNITLLRFIFLSILILACQSCMDDFDDNLKPINFKSLIQTNDELGKLIDQVVNNKENPMLDIVCIDFVYPLTVLVYNENLQVTDTYTLTGDNDFSSFLEGLTTSQYISISYPISTTLADGNTFSVNNNEELKLAIDNCSREDIVSYCNNLFGSDPICIWQVIYSENNDNSYSSGIFNANEDGTINFNFNGEDYIGTWTFLFFNDEFQMNINLEGTSSVAEDWNFSKKVEINNETITILNDFGSIILQKKCEETDIYLIGDEGIAGGTVFFDKGSYSNGWRYMEVATTDLSISEWGCSSEMTASDNPFIGFGFYNSVKTANFHNALENYYINPGNCSALNNGTVISRTALLFDQEEHNDWFLPSEQELLLMYENLYLQNMGNIASATYWSSTEIDASTAKGVDFATGEIISIAKNPASETRARAIRYF